MPDYVYQPYPAWRYHATRGAVLVPTAAEDEALGEGWGAAPIYGPPVDPPIVEAPPPAIVDDLPGLELPLVEPAPEPTPAPPRRRRPHRRRAAKAVATTDEGD